MKYTAKHPSRAAYDLTREEMVTPRVIRELMIDDEWIVRVGQRWVPMKDFLAGVVGGVSLLELPNSPDPAAADAAWTPMSVFSVILRVIGLCLLGVFAYGCWTLLATMMFAGLSLSHVPSSVLQRMVVEYLLYLAIGGYLLSGAPGFVRWVFQLGSSLRS